MIVESLRSVRQSVHVRGAWHTLLLIVTRLYDIVFDLKYGTETYRWVYPSALDVDPVRADSLEPYRPSHAWQFRSVLSNISNLERKVFVDIGCGKGRTLLLAAEAGFGTVRGIELSYNLASIAEDNLRRFRENRGQASTTFELFRTDALNYDFQDDENCFFLFNPFDSASTAQVARNIEASLERAPRTAFVIYAAPEHRQHFDTSPSLIRIHELRLLGQDYVIYGTSRSQEQGFAQSVSPTPQIQPQVETSMSSELG